MDNVPGTRPCLLVRLRDTRDERAWNEFTAIYGPLIYRLACRSGFQDADAADLVQEVLRAVAGAIDRWSPDSGGKPFRNWLFRIARNPMLNLLTEVATLLRQCLVYWEHPTEAPPFPTQAVPRSGRVRNWRTAAIAGGGLALAI